MGCCLPATAAAVTIAAALAAALAATTFLSWARLIHSKGTSTHLQVIQGLNRGVSRVIFHLYETETAKSAGFPIGDHSDAYDLTVLGKHFPNVLLSRRVGQVAYINTLGHLIGSLTDAPPYCVPRNRPG
jgi:dipeptidase